MTLSEGNKIMEIYLIRHGLTEWNKEKRMQGNTDIPLAKEGIELAEKAALELKDIHFDRIYASPLIRAYKTAVILRGERDIPIITDDRIREIGFGEAEGTLFDEMVKDENGPFRYFFEEPGKYFAPKGGESFEEVIERASEFWKEVILPLEDTCERIMIVAHGAVNRAQMCFVENRGPDEYWGDGLQRNCEATVIRLANGVFY